MEYFIIVIVFIGIYLFIAGKKATKKTASKKKAAKPKIIKVIKSEKNKEGLLTTIDVDVLTRLCCQFYKTGSPQVSVFEEKETWKSKYNVKTRRWSGDGSPVLPEYRKSLNEYLKEEWQKAWESFGKPVYDSGRKKPEPAPSDVAFSKLPIKLEYDIEKLSLLPSNYIAQGSSGATYEISLKALECSCPDFSKRRSHYPSNNIRRICKHQARAIIALKMNTKLTKNETIQTFIRRASGDGKGIPPFKEFYEIKINEQIKGPGLFHVLIPEKETLWIEVLFFTQKSYISHGYHLSEKRWGRHANPFPSGSRKKYNWVMAKLAEEILATM